MNVLLTLAGLSVVSSLSSSRSIAGIGGINLANQQTNAFGGPLSTVVASGQTISGTRGFGGLNLSNQRTNAIGDPGSLVIGSGSAISGRSLNGFGYDPYLQIGGINSAQQTTNAFGGNGAVVIASGSANAGRARRSVFMSDTTVNGVNEKQMVVSNGREKRLTIQQVKPSGEVSEIHTDPSGVIQVVNHNQGLSN